MGGLDDVLARLVNDPAFRDDLRTDPAAALAGYELSREDVELLAADLDDDASGERGVEQRTSKSTLLGMLGALAPGTEPSGSSGAVKGSSFQQSTGDEAGGPVRRWHLEDAVVKKSTGPAPIENPEEGPVSSGDGERGG